MGCDNYYINFGWEGNNDVDINDIYERMDLLIHMIRLKQEEEKKNA